MDITIITTIVVMTGMVGLNGYDGGNNCCVSSTHVIFFSHILYRSLTIFTAIQKSMSLICLHISLYCIHKAEHFLTHLHFFESTNSSTFSLFFYFVFISYISLSFFWFIYCNVLYPSQVPNL
ncbi:hypothetical protein PGO_001470 [Plasmodium gonderi]|uniref:Uncharacterized protein n=1 Tax=Plasmodium gonderi TaxID=77519 RepID=A0A1Y1JRT1_PLAGO|nr:hypothetical protein PGO_001470 [Plasmodium gonderi]GAW84168.1 hypothetical protein PGO_001470 [Plasmodium gonderi]